MGHPIRLLTGRDVENLLDPGSCYAAVANAFTLRAEGKPSPSGVLSVPVDGGGFHAKAAMLDLSRPYFVTKVNANFPGNPATHGLPTIQGILLLFDASCGVPLAVMDSVAITTLRTAAASAIAASHLAPEGADTVAIVGCGAQAAPHVAAFASVLSLRRVVVLDSDAGKARIFADDLRKRYDFEVVVASDLPAIRESPVIATCTSSRKPFLGVDHVMPGGFIAAVGADNEHKQEIDAALLAAAAVVVDDLEQCATIGDLHHAIDAGMLTRESVRATLGEVIAGTKAGRLNDDEIIVFDSTGVAIEDVGAAAVTYERAVRDGIGMEINFAGSKSLKSVH